MSRSNSGDIDSPIAVAGLALLSTVLELLLVFEYVLEVL